MKYYVEEEEYALGNVIGISCIIGDDGNPLLFLSEDDAYAFIKTIPKQKYVSYYVREWEYED